jgi:hypothetical protein
MKESAKSWKEKRIEKEENGDDSKNDSDSQSRGDPPRVEINMVFELPWEFHLPADTTTRVDLGWRELFLRTPTCLGNT